MWGSQGLGREQPLRLEGFCLLPQTHRLDCKPTLTTCRNGGAQFLKVKDLRFGPEASETVLLKPGDCGVLGSSVGRAQGLKVAHYFNRFLVRNQGI